MSAQIAKLAAREHINPGPPTQLFYTAIFGPLLAVVLFMNRVYFRYKITHDLGADDFAMFFATIFLVLQGLSITVAIDYGRDGEWDYIAYDDLIVFFFFMWLAQIWWIITINVSKIGVLLLYIRVFSHQRWMVVTSWSFAGIIVAGMISFTAATICECSPIRGMWEVWYTYGSCFDFFAYWYAGGIYNIVTNFLLVAIAVPAVLQCRVKRSLKALLIFFFSLGLITCAASCLRFILLNQSKHSDDVTTGSLGSTLWSMIEGSLGVITACLPMLRQAIEVWFPNLFPKTAPPLTSVANCLNDHDSDDNDKNNTRIVNVALPKRQSLIKSHKRTSTTEDSETTLNINEPIFPKHDSEAHDTKSMIAFPDTPEPALLASPAHKDYGSSEMYGDVTKLEDPFVEHTPATNILHTPHGEL